MDIMFGTVAEYLLDQSLQIAGIFAVVLFLCFLLRRASSHVRYLLWGLVIAKCIFPSVMKVSLAVLPEKEVAAVAAEPEFAAETYAVSTGVSVHADFSDFEAVAPVVYEPSIMDRLGEIGTFEWVGIVWAFGVLLFFGVVCFRAWLMNRRLRSLRRVAELEFCVPGSEGIDVWQIDGIGQPFVWGLLRGSVYVPGNFSECGSVGDQRGILMHEFAHVRRFDAGGNVLQIIAQGLFWFHPLVWFANTMLRREREKCCDESAIAKLKSVPRDYGNAIIDTLAREYESDMRVPSLAVAGPVKNIEDRLKTIMRPGKKFYARCGVFALVTILLLAVVAVPTGLVLTAKAEGTGNDLEKEFFKGWRANRDKLKLGALTWERTGRIIDKRFKDLPELHGDYKMWFDNKKIATVYAEDMLTTGPQGNKIEKITGSTSYKGGMLSRRPSFEGFENWLQVIRWDGPGVNPLDKFIKSYTKMDHVEMRWSMVQVEQGRMLELIGKVVGKKEGTEQNFYSRWLFDPAKGYCLVLKQTFNDKDQLRNEDIAKIKEVDAGLWMPVERSRTLYDLEGKRYPLDTIKLNLAKCKFNDKSGIPDGIFDKKIRDEQKNLDGLLKETSARLKVRGGFHKEIRKSIDAFLKTVADGDKDKAAGFMGRQGLQDFDEMRQLMGPQGVKVEAVYADISAGLVITSVIQADHGRVGPLVFTVNKRDGKWLIDDIDVESAESTKDEIKRFGKEHKGASIVRFAKKAKAKTKAIMFHGLDLSKGPVTTKSYEIGDLFEARPAGSKSFHIRGDVIGILNRWNGASVYYVPKKNVFYVQYDLAGSSTHHYYGPFKGDPRKVLIGLPASSSRDSGGIVDGGLMEMRSYDIGAISRLRNPKLFDSDKDAYRGALRADMQKIIYHIKKGIFSAFTIHGDRKESISMFGMNTLMIYHAPRVHEKIGDYIKQLYRTLEGDPGNTEVLKIPEYVIDNRRRLGDFSNVGFGRNGRNDTQYFSAPYRGSRGNLLLFGAGRNIDNSHSIFNEKVIDNMHIAVECQLVSFDESVLSKLKKSGKKSEGVIKSFLKNGKIKVLSKANRKMNDRDGAYIFLHGKERSEINGYVSLGSKIQRKGKSVGMTISSEYGIGNERSKSTGIQSRIFPSSGLLNANVSVPKGGTILLTLDDTDPIIAGRKLGVLVTPSIIQGALSQISLYSRFIVTSPEFLEDIWLHVFGKDNGKIKDSYFKPKVSYELFEGSKPMEGKKAAAMLRQMGLSEQDDLRFAMLDDKGVDRLLRMTNAHSHSRTLTAPKITVIDGDLASVDLTKEAEYVSGYNDKTYEAVKGSFETGIEIDMIPRVTTDNKYTLVKFDCSMKSQISMCQGKHESGKTYDIPVLLKSQLGVNCRFSEGETLMIAGMRHFAMEGNSKKDPDGFAKFFESKKNSDKEIVIILIHPKVIKRDVVKDRAIKVIENY